MAEASEREARRQAHFAHTQATSPLPASITDIALPGGLQLDDDEFVVRTAKDWGVSVKPLFLTTRRLICTSDLSGRAVAAIRLSDIQDVQLRKHWIGFATIVVNVADQPQASFPAHINGARIRADIQAMVDAARPSASPRLSVVSPPPATADRYERLRQIGELRSSGVLSEAEFEEEKARILREP
ncbi:MAG: SHOCT domain-containing protein [Chloroflexi bacterium]|nr:MAG: SHOCT domain-containing protein [Chloroflexota bacterium]TMD80795.1 MAG: SHOCT domain-containing protein [Chloroflexota bacterium]